MVHPIGTMHLVLNDESMENNNDMNNDEPTPESDGEPDYEPIADDTVDQDSVDSVDQDAAQEMPATEENGTAEDVTAEDGTDILAAAAELQDNNEWNDPIADAPASDADNTFAGGTPHADPTATIPPAPQVAAASRLTRDPFASFGGVLSGIAHNYGWDVALTRILFVLILLATGGTAILAYILAWVLIPRAAYWPPAPTTRRGLSSFSGRDLGMGLVALGALVVIGVGSGEAASVLVPLALVGGGIWLLVQNPRTDAVPQMAGPQMAGPPMGAQMTTPLATAYAGSGSSMGAGPAPQQPIPPTNYASQPVAPQAAPRRSWLRRIAILLGIGAIGLVLMALVVGPILLFTIGGDNIDFEFNSDPVIFDVDNIDEIPSIINEDGGEIFIDLTNVDFNELADDADPVSLEVNLGAGEITVRLPDDVRVQLDAETDFVGELDIFGSETDGISPEVSLDADDPQLILDLEVNAGRIEVTRESSSVSRSIVVELD